MGTRKRHNASDERMIEMTTYSTFFAFYADGYSEKVEFPSDWTLDEVKKALGTDDVMEG
jgi:hypothetical protein